MAEQGNLFIFLVMEVYQMNIPVCSNLWRMSELCLEKNFIHSLHSYFIPVPSVDELAVNLREIKDHKSVFFQTFYCQVSDK